MEKLRSTLRRLGYCSKGKRLSAGHLMNHKMKDDNYWNSDKHS